MEEFHVLDLVMYAVIGYIIFRMLGDEFTQEIGALVGMMVMVVYTIIYVILFAFCDYNWIEIFQNTQANFPTIKL
jgi:hypothetical protein